METKKEQIKRVFDEAMSCSQSYNKTIVEKGEELNEDGTSTYYVTLGDWLIIPETLDTIRKELTAIGAKLDAIVSADRYNLRFHVNA